MAAEIAFHTGVSDALAYACRLLRKAYARGARVAVTGAPERLDRLDPALWTFDAGSFVPHVRLPHGATLPARLARTPLWLVDQGSDAPHREVLVNLGPEAVQDFDGFGRVIEIVGREAGERDAGRRRWRFYEQRGARIAHHPQEGA